MPRTIDTRVIESRKKKYDRIRNRFVELMDKGYRYDIVMEKMIEETGYSESTISQIYNKNGNYKE
jgi:AraC-like DNA-binding protein